MCSLVLSLFIFNLFWIRVISPPIGIEGACSFAEPVSVIWDEYSFAIQILFYVFFSDVSSAVPADRCLGASLAVGFATFDLWALYYALRIAS